MRLQRSIRGAAQEASAVTMVVADEPNMVSDALEQDFVRPVTFANKQLSSLRVLPTQIKHELRVGHFGSTRIFSTLNCTRNCIVRTKRFFLHLYTNMTVRTVLLEVCSGQQTGKPVLDVVHQLANGIARRRSWVQINHHLKVSEAKYLLLSRSGPQSVCTTRVSSCS